MLTEGENKKKTGIDVSSETKTVAISTKHLSSTCHCHCTGSKGRRSNYLQLPISKRDMEKMTKRMADFGGDNPFASGSAEKDAADKKNEERECHLLVHKI